MNETTIAKRAHMLECPECGTDLIEPVGRGRIDASGNEIRHRDSCRCRWCSWWWWTDDQPPKRCACGCLVRVESEDGHAFAVVVELPPPHARPRDEAPVLAHEARGADLDVHMNEQARAPARSTDGAYMQSILARIENVQNVPFRASDDPRDLDRWWCWPPSAPSGTYQRAT